MASVSVTGVPTGHEYSPGGDAIVTGAGTTRIVNVRVTGCLFSSDAVIVTTNVPNTSASAVSSVAEVPDGVSDVSHSAGKLLDTIRHVTEPTAPTASNVIVPDSPTRKLAGSIVIPSDGPIVSARIAISQSSGHQRWHPAIQLRLLRAATQHHLL